MALINSYIPEAQLYHDLKDMGRDNFSYEGAKALMNYLEQLSEDIGENIEYDPIAFCCDYAEYESIGMLADEYGAAPQADDYDDPDDWDDALMQWLNDNTSVIEFDGGIIVQSF